MKVTISFDVPSTGGEDSAVTEVLLSLINRLQKYSITDFTKILNKNGNSIGTVTTEVEDSDQPLTSDVLVCDRCKSAWPATFPLEEGMACPMSNSEDCRGKLKVRK